VKVVAAAIVMEVVAEGVILLADMAVRELAKGTALRIQNIINYE